MNEYKIHRSLPSLDLISLASNANDIRSTWDTTTNVESLSKKRISSNNGWDHYGSCKEKYRKSKYQLWREGKYARSKFGAPDLKQLSKVSLHTTFSSITEQSNESTSTSSFETGGTNRISTALPHSSSVFVDSPGRRYRHSPRKVEQLPKRLSTM